MPTLTQDDSCYAEASTTRLVHLARQGVERAFDALYARCLLWLPGWVRWKLPSRGHRFGLATTDVVQDVLFGAWRRLPHFEPTHRGAYRSYLRKAVDNRIRDDARRLRRRFEHVALVDDRLAHNAPSAERQMIANERWASYRMGLSRLSEREKRLIVGHKRLGFSYPTLAEMYGYPTPDAARMATNRALVRLATLMADG